MSLLIYEAFLLGIRDLGRINGGTLSFRNGLGEYLHYAVICFADCFDLEISISVMKNIVTEIVVQDIANRMAVTVKHGECYHGVHPRTLRQYTMCIVSRSIRLNEKLRGEHDRDMASVTVQL